MPWPGLKKALAIERPAEQLSLRGVFHAL
jgi:hypothetical protein